MIPNLLINITVFDLSFLNLHEKLRFLSSRRILQRELPSLKTTLCPFIDTYNLHSLKRNMSIDQNCKEFNTQVMSTIAEVAIILRKFFFAEKKRSDNQPRDPLLHIRSRRSFFSSSSLLVLRITVGFFLLHTM